MRTEGYEVRRLSDGQLKVTVSPLMSERFQQPNDESPRKITRTDGTCLICRGTECQPQYNLSFIKSGYMVTFPDRNFSRGYNRFAYTPANSPNSK